MGHLALTDGASGTFEARERFSRGALGLAGARAEPFRVWIEDWVVETDSGATAAEGAWPGSGIFPLRLEASDGGVGLDLRLEPSKPVVLQGEDGLSQKGPEPGNASFYYSFTRLVTTGSVTLGGREIPVQGQAWLDREWSTSALSQDQVGWDWFALQLGDGRDLMYYQLRLRDGRPDPLSKGVLVDADGRARPLTSGTVELTVLDRWASPRDGSVYPSRWRLVLPDEAIDLEIEPLVPDQEMNLTFRYWEGAVLVRGTSGGRPLEGRGYVELTGYGEEDSEGEAGAPRTDRAIGRTTS
jgi:predicted secreted hydrolase